MSPIRCAQCGLTNIPERQTCKRCHAPLPPPVAHNTAQVITPVQSPASLRSKSNSAYWRFFAIARDITSPLPFSVAHQRLTTLLQQAEAGQLERSGYAFYGEYTNEAFRLYGPHGKRAWPLVTSGQLIATATGAHVAVTIRPIWLYPLVIVAGFGAWLWGAFTILQGGMLLFPLGALVLVVVMLLASVKSEGQMILDLLVDVLSVESVVPLD